MTDFLYVAFGVILFSLPEILLFLAIYFKDE